MAIRQWVFVIGQFIPNENYQKYQNIIREYQHYNGAYGHKDIEKLQNVQHKVDALDLQVRIANGEILQPGGGVHITDLSVELDMEEMHVNVLGLPRETYQKYFQSLIDEYESRFH